MNELDSIQLPAWKVTGGASAKEFLQGQITNDVYGARNEFMLGTSCDANGILLEWFWWHCTEEGGWFIAPPGRQSTFEGNILKRKRWRDDIQLKPSAIQFSTTSEEGIHVEGWREVTKAVPQEGEMNEIIESWNEWESSRIRSGLPSHEQDLENNSRPYEIGLERAVHQGKGCYVGQEVLARLDSLSTPKRQLIRFEAAAGLACGEELIEQELGITGVVTSLCDTGHGLARFGRGQLLKGTLLTSPSGGRARCS